MNRNMELIDVAGPDTAGEWFALSECVSLLNISFAVLLG